MVRDGLRRSIPETFAGRKVILAVATPGPCHPIRGSGGQKRGLRRANPGRGSSSSGTSMRPIDAAGLKDGMTISTHHALRNGDFLLNQLVRVIDSLGLRDIKIASSSIHPVNAELIPYIRKGVITGFECGVNGLIGGLISICETVKLPIIMF